ncbi:alpha/beta hydrolase [Leptospira sp. WS92.C1]
MKSFKSRLFAFLIFGILLGILILHFATVITLAPVRTTTSLNPIKGMKDVEIDSGGLKIRGWLFEAPNEKAVVLLLHGIRANRLSMLNRAKFLHSKGYSSLLLDFQAHGESEGDLITLGLKESENVRAAIRYLKNTKRKLPIGVIGSSLGGASALMADISSKIRFLILEAVFPDIESAIRNRLNYRLFKPLGLFTPLVYEVLRYELKIPDSGIRPIDLIARVTCPVFVISGAVDLYTPESEALDLFRNAPDRKDLWIVEGAEHVDLYRHAPREYEKRIFDFIETYR